MRNKHNVNINDIIIRPEFAPDLQQQAHPEYCPEHCKCLFKTVKLYEDHTKSKSELVRERYGLDLVADESVTPDLDDPNCYCSSCNFTFTSRNNYNEHLFQKHDLKKKWFYCTAKDCGQKFAHKSQRIEQMALLTPEP